MNQILVNAPFTTLSEGFCAPVYTTQKWFLARVNKLMFNQILLQGKLFSAQFAFPVFFDFVDFHMSFEAIFGFERFFAFENVTFETFPWHFLYKN